MKKLLAGLATGLFLFGLAGTASATILKFSEYHLGHIDQGGIVDIDFDSLPQPAATDLYVEFWVYNDLGANDEFLQITIDGSYDFGLWLNNIAGDDTISGSDSDVGSGGATNYGWASVSSSEFNTLLTDGALRFTFDFSANVDAGGAVTKQYARVDITYSTEPVPEPASMILFGLGLLGLAGVNRRK